MVIEPLFFGFVQKIWIIPLLQVPTMTPASFQRELDDPKVLTSFVNLHRDPWRNLCFIAGLLRNDYPNSRSGHFQASSYHFIALAWCMELGILTRFCLIWFSNLPLVDWLSREFCLIFISQWNRKSLMTAEEFLNTQVNLN